MVVALTVACGGAAAPTASDTTAARSDNGGVDDAPAETSSTSVDDDLARLRDHLDALADRDRWMGSVAVAKDGELRFAYAAGRVGAAPDSPPVDPDTRFRIGSITKTFTATLIFQLIEEGELALDTKLARFFPGIPHAGEITIEQMLDHHSGIFSLTEAPDYFDWSGTPQTRDALVARIRDHDPAFAPGERGAYSNSNYLLLGFIVEDVTGRPFADVLAARIVEPLALAHTGVGGPIEPARNQAASLLWEGRWTAGPETDLSVPGAAGAMVSTPTDLCRFAHELFAGDLVSPASREQMMTLEDGIGRGMFRFPRDEGPVAWGHTGGIDGFASILGYFPVENVCIAITTHAANWDMERVVDAAFRLSFGLDWEEPDLTVVALTVADLEPLLGTYVSDDLPLDIEIARRGTVLYGQATGQPAFPLTPESRTNFVFEPAAVRIVFHREGDGGDQPATGFTLHQHGTYLFRRAPE